MMVSRWSDLQLRFDLPDLDEVSDDATDRVISFGEARQISEAGRLALERILGRSEEVEAAWRDEYAMLLQQGWPWRVACYMAWASSPKLSRWPRTLQELATEVLNLTGPRVIYKWRNKFPAIDATVAMLQAAPLWEHRRDVMEALATMASLPDYKSFNDRKLFLEMIGDYTPKSKLEVGKSGKSGDLSELSDEELEALMGSEIAPFADERSQARNDCSSQTNGGIASQARNDSGQARNDEEAGDGGE